MDSPKIMIVEDNTAVAEDCRDCLQELGYRVVALVASGEESIWEAEIKRPDVVLMDIQLRGKMDGIEAAEHIHSRFAIPLLFLSAYSDRQLLQRAKTVGSFGYLVKPFEERELYAMLEMTLYKARAQKKQRRLEARLRRLQKAESLSRMAGAVAHHFNNMLYVTLGNLEMAREELPPEMTVHKNIVEAEKAARRASEMSLLMLTYLGHQPAKTEPLDLAAVCQEALETLQPETPDRGSLASDLPRPGPVIKANAGQIKQAITALLANAWEAMADDLPCRVRVSLAIAEAADIPETHRFPPDCSPTAPRYAALAISDTGRGMEPDTIEAIFDPFFTDKLTGRGLGLAVVLGIVKAHGGCIAVESTPGQGSRFTLFFPLSPKPLPRTREESAQGKPTAFQGETILLVEDQEMVRKTATAMLQRLGLRVLAAKDGHEAVARFREHSADIRVLISDLSMPGMDGWQTLAAVRKIRPDIPVILASGYDEAQAMAGDHPGEKPQAFLHKPYRLQTLRQTLERVLAGSTTGNGG